MQNGLYTAANTLKLGAMDFDANLEVMQANLQPPPGHERVAAPVDGPAEGLVFEVQAPLSGTRDPAHRRRLADAAVKSRSQAPVAGSQQTSMLTTRRLVSSGAPIGGAITEAVGNIRSYPMSAVGKVTAQFEGTVRNCTGTVVAERVVLTAAHCIYFRGGPGDKDAVFATSVKFEPQFSGDHGAGIWAGEKAYIHKGWADPAEGTTQGPYDYGFIRLGAPIAHITGTASVLASSQNQGPYVSVGYPRVRTGAFNWDGRFMYATTGRRIIDGSVGTMKAENSLTEGSSGGPWFTAEAGGHAVAGLNSTKPVRGNDHTWSPIFGDGFQRLFARVLADMTGT